MTQSSASHDETKPRILVLDDDLAMCEMLADGLGRRGFEVDWQIDPRIGLQDALDSEYYAVLTDLNMRHMDGLKVCAEIVERRPSLPVLVITAFGSLESATAAIRAGAYDFITKPLDLDVIAIALRRAIQHKHLREEVQRLREVVASNQVPADIVGESPAMRHLFAMIDRVATSQATVLVIGESGIGKELVARALHRKSGRPPERFVALNCAAVPETLLESELFGHVRGAFTDARVDRTGLFAQADGGALFLDEIAELPLTMQAKLLRVLQERTVRPIGANREIPVNVRLIAATNRDLETAVQEATFRDDLLYRINVVQLDIPPLRVRGDDILSLAQHFLKAAAARADKRVVGLSSPVASALLRYSWPGNVRELENVIERAVILTAHDYLVVDDLPSKLLRRPAQGVADETEPEYLPMDEVERRYILKVLDAVGGNRTMAAKILGFDRRTISRKLKAYGLADVP